MDLKLFASTYALIFLAELPDKTIFATMLLAAQREARAVFVGVCAAFVVQTVVAVVFGSALGILPGQWIHWGAGAMFLVFAAAAWLKGDKAEEGPSLRLDGAFWATVRDSFVVIFIAEWGDLTQLSTAALAAHSGKPLTIFCAAVLGLWTATALAVALGRQAKNRVHPKTLRRVGACAFAVVGIWMLARAA